MSGSRLFLIEGKAHHDRLQRAFEIEVQREIGDAVYPGLFVAYGRMRLERLPPCCLSSMFDAEGRYDRDRIAEHVVDCHMWEEVP